MGNIFTSVLRKTISPEEPMKPSKRTGGTNVLGMAVLFAFTVYFLLPLYWLIISSTKTTNDLFSGNGLWFSGQFQFFQNLQGLFSYDGGIFISWFINTFLYAIGSAVISTLIAAMAGYALAKFKFYGKNTIFSIVLGSLLVPTTALSLPLYLLMAKAGLTNTYWAVLLPSFVSPFGVYLARVYSVSSIPDEMLDAARVDGAGEFRVFFRIALAALTPSLITIFLFQFVAVWNNYFLPLVMLSNQNLFPLTVGLQSWNAITTSVSGQGMLYSYIIMGSLISVLPLIIGFLFLQRYWRAGIVSGSIK